ncbi:MAG: deoxyhypusine synthase [Planctomycetaceae bacterium]|jgi:deoxyhypusine synthase|nr:deoxyhypusine synthase [Phycisphaerales bacterium]MCE2653373.1 deoxyhypusine synthase [Planctomycetaceae bacterium]
MANGKWTKKDLLSRPVKHVDITSFDARPVIDSYRNMAFSSRTLAQAADIYSMMLKDTGCGVIVTLAGSLVSAGLKKALITMVECNMIDAIVSTGANIVDQDFFEGLGFKHYIAPGSPEAPPVDDMTLRNMMIDRIYDTYINEDDLRACDHATYEIFNAFAPGAYSSREFIEAMGAYLANNAKFAKNESLVKTCYQKRVPIFVPAFSDCSAGFGIVLQQTEAIEEGRGQVAIDSGKDFRELTDIKLACKDTGLLMMGGGVPKNFAQDIVVAAELLNERKGGKARGDIGMHKYAVQITVADSRDGALSGSTLREACSWGKVDVVHEQMVFGEISSLLPILASDAYHRGAWRKRKGFKFADLFEKGEGMPTFSGGKKRAGAR